MGGAPLVLARILAYAAPTTGSYFFYIPMWSILPGIYAKYFGLSLTSIASVVLFIRLFDGFIDTMIGYMSDWHRARGGSRKSWVIVGGLTTIVSCYFLVHPPQPATTAYYLGWSMVYFVAFTIAEIPHLTWGSELTLDYHCRAKVFGVRFVMTRLGMIVFYALPLLPLYASAEYTPEVLQDGLFLGGIMTLLGVTWAFLAAPAGVGVETVRQDTWRLFVRSIIRNKPLLLYFAAFGFVGVAGGMWYGLIFFYLDSYLGLGAKVAMMFMLATVISAVSTPLWLKLIHRTSKATVWAIGVGLFAVQLLGTLWLRPGVVWWIPLLLVIVTNLFFGCHDVAAQSILGDIADYGKWKFRQDRGATYFGFNTLIFKVGIGIGGGLALGIAGLFGFDPASAVHDARSILGLKLGFVFLPLIFAVIGVGFILRTPINPRRHRIIQRRLESRLMR
jgi:GPH family glycoside/pentoside/hexuronide:cation symporter